MTDWHKEYEKAEELKNSMIKSGEKEDEIISILFFS